MKKDQFLKGKLDDLKKKLAEGQSSSSSADPQTLKKDGQEESLKKDSQTESLKKDGQAKSLKKDGKATGPAVVVDWHNTVEVGDMVSQENIHALDALADMCQVHIISYVASMGRKKVTLAQIKELIPVQTLKKVASYRCIWHLCEEGGKVDWAWHLEAEAIFDDQPPVIKEARDWALEAYAIQGPKLHTGSTHLTFADAVDVYLKKFDMPVEPLKKEKKNKAPKPKKST